MHRLAILVLLLAPAVSPAAGPTCALLDPEKSPRAALLAGKLLEDSSASWVERAEIDKVLKEQKLQAAFGPQGVGERVKLGKLLKADVLVMVRPAKDAKEPVLEVVVSETAGGLRLLHRAVPMTKNADEDVAALVAAAREGIRKHGEKVTEVVAVPPFVSNDLGYEFEHLKGAFAKLAESVALDRKGIVVVELAEAEALARELALAAPGAGIERPSPLYLVGEYRHAGRGDQRTVTLKLRVERAGKVIGKAETLAVKSDAAPEALRKWAAGVLDATGGAVALPNPKAEAKRLGELVVVHQRLGNWPEAMALIEASLLLDPKQPELNADAMAILRYWIEQTLRRYGTDRDYLTKAATLHRRGLAHMEVLLAHGELLPRHRGYGHLPMRVFESTFPLPKRQDPLFNYSPPYAPEERAVIDELEKDHRDAFRRALPLAAKNGTRYEMEVLVKGAVGILPAAEHYAQYAKLVLQYQDSKGMIEAMNGLLAGYPVVYTAEGFQVYRKFLDALDKDGNAGVREAVGRFRKTLPAIEKNILEMMAKRIADEEERQRRIAEAKKNPLPRPPSTIRFNATRAELDKEIDEKQKGTPLRRIDLKAASADDDWFVDQVMGVVAAGPSIDVFWAPGRFLHPKPGDDPNRPKAGAAGSRDGLALFVMKEKGVLKRVFGKPTVPDKVTDMCFDGKYVWITAEGHLSRTTRPALFVLDPAAETVHEVTAAEGLPEAPDEVAKDPRRNDRLTLRVAPLDKGRVCVAGWFGRAWIAVATFDGEKNKAAVKVIHEAKEVPRQGEKEPWLNPHLSFVPEYARTLRGKAADGKPAVRVLIGRGSPTSAMRVSDYLGPMGNHPLSVDPDAGTVETVKDPIRITGWQIGANGDSAGGAVYVAYPLRAGFTCDLFRIDYPGKVTDLGALAIPRATSSTQTMVVGDRLYFGVLDFGGKRVPQPGGDLGYGSLVWTSDLDGKNVRKLAENTLRIRNIQHSSHYGLLVWCDLGDALTRWVCNELVVEKK
jgi:hypothetical protein